jgi:Na+-transporting NADH:ubiquinone oxidoreductase subunit NqrE
MLSTIAEIIRDLLIFVGVIAALLIALVMVVSRMPNTQPVKAGTNRSLLSAMCHIGSGSYCYSVRAHTRN